MNATPTSAVIKEFAWAAEAIAEMQAAADLDQYEKAWIDYLHYLDRGWNKLEKLLASISQQKLSHARQHRQADALLSYLMHARNVDEHTIRQVVAKRPSSLKITGSPGGGTIHRGVFSGDGQVGNLEYDGSLDIYFVPERMEIIGVTDGVCFIRDFPIELNFYWKPLENHHDFNLKTSVKRFHCSDL
jgi:hypothetical protein